MSTHVIKSTMQRTAVKTIDSKTPKYNKLKEMLPTANGSSLAVKSKYAEERKMLAPIRIRSLRLDAKPTAASLNKQQQQVEAHVKHEPKSTSQSAGLRKPNRKDLKAKDSVKAEETVKVEIGIQTQEQEILNHDLLIGDIKFMWPSKSLVFEIDKDRQEAKKKILLRTQRKFEEYAEREEQHLTDLKEFLEKAAVTKRVRKPKDTPEINKKYRLISSMDEMLNREVRCTESITDIKGRIKKKEKELISIFETIDNIKIPSNKI